MELKEAKHIVNEINIVAYKLAQLMNEARNKKFSVSVEIVEDFGTFKPAIICTIDPEDIVG